MSPSPVESRDDLVSVIIPTLNEGESLPICLESVRKQTYAGVEVIVVDSSSVDGTREAARKAGASLVDYPGKPLGARREGLKHSHGPFVLLLDADQVLYHDSLERAMKAMAGVDMLVLEESSYQPKGFLQRSISRQKEALQVEAEEGEVPPHAYPRLFRREVLEGAFSRLPGDTLGKIFIYDDRILCSQARAISTRVGMLRHGVMHMEEGSWREMMRHAYRLGKSAKAMEGLGLEKEAEAPEPPTKLFMRALRHRYLTYSALKEICFSLGRLSG